MSNNSTPIISQLESSNPSTEDPLKPLVIMDLDAVLSKPPQPRAAVALCDYELMRELGRGGMAIVYEAIEIEISRRVAIKILPSSAVLDERQLTRFRTEALATARLDHPHIVPVYNVGIENGVPFYTMKYIDGRSLAELIVEYRQEASLPASPEFFCRVARWGIQAAEALQCAHAHGILHGDVKPANLLVDQNEHLWLIDFGAARIQSNSPDREAPVSAGTVRYLSPELVCEDTTSIDHRSDIYSLGASLFEVIALRPAVEGDNSNSVLNQIAHGTRAHLRDHNIAIPIDLDAIICRAMETNPQARYATASEFADDLRRFLDGQPVAAKSKTVPSRDRLGRVVKPRSARWIASLLAIVLGITSLGFVTILHMRSRATPRLTESEKSLRFAAAIANIQTAEVNADTGRIQEAKQQAESVLNQITELHESDPENSLFLIGLAFAHTRVGTMLADVLPPKEAENHHRTAIEWLEPLVSDSIPWQANDLFPFQNYRNALDECYLNLASCLQPSKESEAILHSAIASLSERESESKMDPWRTHLLARTHRQLGSVQSTRGKHLEAEKELLQSIGLLQQLSTEFPTQVRFQFDLALAESDFASALLSAGKKPEASERTQRAIDRLEPLVTVNAEFAGYHHRLAGNLNNLVNLTDAISPTDAISTITKALHHELIAIRLSPENRQYRRFASIQYSNLAGHWEQQNEHTQAAESKSSAIQHRQFIIEHSESLYDDQHQLGHYWLDLGSILAGAHRDDEAENAYRTSTEQFRELVAQFGRKPHDLCMLAEALNKTSMLMEKREDLDRAKRYLEQAMVHEQDAVRYEPSNADHRKTLLEYQARMDTLNRLPLPEIP